MKNSYWVALCGLVCGVPAWAQSQVSLSGSVDVMLNHVQGGSTSVNRLEDGGNAASRIAFKGSEDLGDGLRTNFVLEGGFSPATGQGTIPGPDFGFTRQAFVGISGPWGSVDMGRMYTPLFYSLLRNDALGMNTLFSSLNIIAATDAQKGLRAFAPRASSMVRYRSPSDQAITVDAAYGFDTTTVANSRPGDFAGFNIGWNAQPFNVSYAYQRAVDRSTAVTTSTYQTVGAGYDLSPSLRLTGNYIVNSVNVAGTPDAKIIQFGATWNVSPASKVVASVARRLVDGSPRDQTTWTLGYDYALSKRTALYARWLNLTNAANAAVTLAKIPVGANSGDDGRSIGFGLRHHF